MGADRFNRRRFMITAATAAAALSMGGSRARAAVRWRGVAMGADATLVLIHEDRAMAARALRACIDEITRLEMILSLYEPESELSRLNRNGRLAEPSIDFVRCLGDALAVSELTGGAFDITVQPLFDLYRAWYADPAHRGAAINADRLAATRALVDYRDIRLAADAVSFRRPAMAATLNGIGQGYICDRVAALLRGFGFTDAMVNLGEVEALGHSPEGDPWSVAVNDPTRSDDSSLAVLDLVDRALATSAPRGHVFDAGGQYHHLFDPKSGLSSNRYLSITVAAPTATLADGLSTAMAALPLDAIETILANTGALDLLLLDAQGNRVRLKSAS